ncbi:cobalamin-5-phosphate synthase-domain-containing protein [Pavlovales sp. CCMP2436]|nr:cobalamin-5-phosphate synthase-domain-containing protein [Pavlovales sp. CCMP2436]|mmetsp:Transcript_9586/g.22395  ORF Transcript_9586/g.22395 Transcript_9586/m.22395 type:complete len:367 (-) Transcript_9586:139-1239(-)
MAPNNALRDKTTAEVEALAAIANDESWGMISSEEVRARGVGTKETMVDEFMAGPKSELRCFFTGMMFVTRLPCPGWCDHHPGYLMRAMAWLPTLGMLIGLWVAAFIDAAAALAPPTVAAAASTGAGLWLTGCFHEDGLGDSLDGLGGGWTKAQIMRIMKDSRIGSYACMGLTLWTLSKVILLGELGPSVWEFGACAGQGPALVVAHAVARASSSPLIWKCAYVVDAEDAKGDFYGWFGRSRELLTLPRVGCAIASAVAVTVGVYGPTVQSAAVLLTAIFGTVFAGLYGNSVLGGVMGDFLGATICCIELSIYALLAVDPARLPALAASVGWARALRPFGMLAVALATPKLWTLSTRHLPKAEEKEC